MPCRLPGTSGDKQHLSRTAYYRVYEPEGCVCRKGRRNATPKHGLVVMKVAYGDLIRTTGEKASEFQMYNKEEEKVESREQETMEKILRRGEHDVERNRRTRSPPHIEVL
ncbi:hypothetical protein FRC02_003465 [Tulasnella sp. 418]|nr:hypothetical protein FRC02_003465 [Tulasnella sp. 418]